MFTNPHDQHANGNPPARYDPPLSFRTTGSRRRATISLTPLIDVVFILLVFFMLASSFLDWRAIRLDAPGRATAGSSMEGALLVEVRAEGLRLSGVSVAIDVLEQRIADHLARDPGRLVLVKPAAGIALQDAVTVIDRLSAAGARNLSLVRDRQAGQQR